ncbi:GGDEF domain-containing protein [Deltaproteobacteria bacterium TL4]
MIRKPLCTIQLQEHPQLSEFAQLIQSGRYFKKMELDLIKNLLRRGELITLEKDDTLIHEGDDSPPELYILIEGSLAVMAHSKFILRLETPGDVVGEMSVIQPSPRSADVVAEGHCKLVVFSAEMLTIKQNAESAPIIYVMLTHVLADKLKMTTAQSLIRKGERVLPANQIKVGLIDETFIDRLLVKGVVETNWSESTPIEIDDLKQFMENPLENRFNLIVVDVLNAVEKPSTEHFKELFRALKMHGAPIFVISEYCNDSIQRDQLLSHGADELMTKPYSISDLKHQISKYRVLYYQHCELDKAEHDAETDRLTGLANRRRLDEFLQALGTLYADNQQPFSLIIADVDNFKHYNDTHGHQMGDVVLSRVGALFGHNVRRGDLAARFGGEEFVMVLPNCGLEAAQKTAEKLRKAIEDEVFPYQDQQPTGNLTATFGVATYPDSAQDIVTLLKKADDCLYQGKKAGRNVVVVHGKET